MLDKSFFPKPSIFSGHQAAWQPPLPVEGRMRSTHAERLSVWALLGQWQSMLQERLQGLQPLLRPGLRLVVCGGLLWVWGTGQDELQVQRKVRTFSEAPLRKATVVTPFLFSKVDVRSSQKRSLTKKPLAQTLKQMAPRTPSRSPLSGGALSSAPSRAKVKKKKSQGGRAPLVRGVSLRKPLARRLFLISWDGAKASVMREMMKRGKLPAVSELLREGLGTFSARTVIPSLTLPSHTSMLTGLKVEHHGVRWNSFQKRRGAIHVPTILDLMSKDGLAAGFFVSKKKLMHLVQKRDRYLVFRRHAHALDVLAGLLSHLQQHPLRFVFWHLRDPDRAGHWFGWGNEVRSPAVAPSSAYRRALVRSDESLGRLVRYLRERKWWDETALILTADHGGHDRTHGTAHPQDRHIPWILGGGALKKKRCALSSPIHTYDTAATALWLLGVRRPSGMDGRSRLHCL
ncbi:MAG: alkaline phosphatase family protein [Myxococcales bacterium]|nr:alkaline phosphatase family protein [Myxococcales bacterium]